MTDVVIVDALRSPVGRRNGGLASLHPAELLANVQKGILDRVGIDPNEVGQVVGGCVSQIGEQSFNVTRTAWLSAGLPLGTAATTVDTQCGSSQQATNLATSLIAAGVVDVALACGVEVMSRVPIGSNSNKNLGLGVPIPKTYFGQYEFTSQFEGAERIADKWGVTREVRTPEPTACRQGMGRRPLCWPVDADNRTRPRCRPQSTRDNSHSGSR